MMLIAACGGSGATASSTLPPTTPPPSTTLAATTTLPPATTLSPTTTPIAPDCHSYGEAVRAISQSLLFQTFDGAAALQAQRGDELATSLLGVSVQIGSIPDQVASLGEPPPGFEEGIALMVEAIGHMEPGYAAARDATLTGDEAAFDDAIAAVDEGFNRLLDANEALATAMECSLGE